ncbi:MAG TPA: AMP-binding protein [Bacillota bacterium]|nr:AMP-binding protein [Bacillota bacterium]
MSKQQKTERKYTPASSMKHFCEKIGEHGYKIAYMWFDGAHELHEMTYRELADSIKNLSAAFASFGWQGRRIAILGETSPQWIITYAAAIASGNVAIPLDKELKLEELRSFLRFAEADALVYSGSFNRALEDKVKNDPAVSLYIPMSLEDCPYAGENNVMSFDEMLARGERYVAGGYEIPEPQDLNRMAVMLFTSGTTGTSKCVMLSEKNVISVVNAACESVEFYPEDTIVSVLPIHHTYELSCMLAALNYGMNIGINDSLKRVLKNFNFFRPTGLVLVPLFINTMYKKIWEEAKKKKKEKILKAALATSSRLRKMGIDLRRVLFSDIISAFGGRLCKIISGGAPLNPNIAEKFEEFGITICEGYGITECSPLISVNPYYANKHGSVGTAVNCCTVRINPEGVNEQGYTEGEIEVKGDNVMLGYYKNPEATAEAFTEDGWFRTGDVGYIDEDGYIYITGRKKSVIVLENGKNVFPEEIEEYLGNLSTVAECVVVGRKKEDDPDTVVLTAIIYPNFDAFPEGTDINEIAKAVQAEVNAMNRGLVGYKQIRKVEIRKTEFEKTTSRKIKRHLVK